MGLSIASVKRYPCNLPVRGGGTFTLVVCGGVASTDALDLLWL